MSIKNRSKHLMIMFPENLVQQIDDYKSEHNIRSRNKAIRQLIETGLKDAHNDE